MLLPTGREIRHTLLGRLLDSGFPIVLIGIAAAIPSSTPLAKLILASQDILRRTNEEWAYKSLAHICEEEFIRSASAWWAPDLANWETNAARSFSEYVHRSILNHEDGLLDFFVRTDDQGYRRAEAGDAPYDFIRLLIKDQYFSDLTFAETPVWAKELFIHRPNYEAFRRYAKRCLSFA